MQEARDFMATRTPRRRSRLIPYHEGIMLLRENDYTYDAIREFLENVGVRVTTSAVHAYISRHADKKPTPPAPAKLRGEENAADTAGSAPQRALSAREKSDAIAAKLLSEPRNPYLEKEGTPK